MKPGIYEIGFLKNIVGDAPSTKWRVLDCARPKALVVGAAGGLGRALSGRLTEDGWLVAKVTRDGSRGKQRVVLPNGETLLLTGDALKDAASLLDSGFAPDRIFCAQGRTGAVGSLDSFEPENVSSVRHAVALGAETKAGVVLAGTLSVFVSSTEAPPEGCEESFVFDDGFALNGGYAASKWVADEFVRRAGGCVVRLGLLVPKVPPENEFLDALARQWASASPRVPPSNAQSIVHDVTPTEEAARIMAELARKDECPGVVNCSGGPITLSEWFDFFENGIPTGAGGGKAGKALMRAALNRESLRRDSRLFNVDLFQSTGARFSKKKLSSLGVKTVSLEDAKERWRTRMELASNVKTRRP